MESYLRKNGVDNPTIPKAMKGVVSEYLRDGYQWFVFDVISVGKEVGTKEAIQYRFATRSLYYPLRITRSEAGDTTIRLLVLSPKLVRLPKLGAVRVTLPHDPLVIGREELKSLGNKDFSTLLTGKQSMLRTWEIKGPLSGFRSDILTPPLWTVTP